MICVGGVAAVRFGCDYGTDWGSCEFARAAKGKAKHSTTEQNKAKATGKAKATARVRCRTDADVQLLTDCQCMYGGVRCCAMAGGTCAGVGGID